MPRDTTDRTVTRPNVEEQLDDRLADTVNPLVRIPGDRLTFGDRLEVLLDEYEERGEKIARQERKIEELEEQLAEERSGVIR